MCGIAGIVSWKGSTLDGSRIRRMTKAMAHRGPDAEGLYEEETMALGHLRLSIIDLSSAANQPFPDSSGRYLLVFNGEIYNYKEVKKLLPDYPFRTTSDTEVLIAAYSRWGAGCLDHLRGMFAFAIWDRQEKEIFIARDRFGVKPLYYAQRDGQLVFASEIRAILASGLIPAQIEKAAILEFFSYQSVSYPYSPIEGILQLEAGTWMKIKNGNIVNGAYWDPTHLRSDFDYTDKVRVQEKIRDLMEQSIRRRLVSDVPVGAFLSGGIDSSAVVGLMAAVGDKSPETFNVYFEEAAYDESAYADLIARKFNTNHKKILLKPTVFLDELQNALNSMDTPSGDGINTYVVSKAIRQNGITVALSGAGGDELFAGYPFFQHYLDLHKNRFLWNTPALFRRTMASALAAGSHQGKNARMGQLLLQPSGAIENVYPVFRQLLSPGAIRQLTTLGGQGPLPNAVAAELEARKEQLAAMPLLSQVSVAEYLGYTQHTLLKDTDQMSMAVSLEVREPFFDQDLVEFVLSVPDSLKKPVYPKSLLVESLKPLLPDEVVHRKKQGFLFPWEYWLKNELRDFAQRHIINMSQRSFIKQDALLGCWKRFLAGDRNIRWSELWLFIVLDHWMEKNQVSG